MIDVGVLVSFVDGVEVVISLSLEHAQQSVSIFDILIGLIDGESGHEIPRSNFSVEQSSGEGCQESEPESETIFLDLLG